MADYGSGECPECGGTFKLKQEGTLRHHLGTEVVGRFRQTCNGVGRLPVKKPLGQEFPCVPGSLWRDAEAGLWVLCTDGRMRKVDELEEPDGPEELVAHFGPLVREGS